MEWDCTVVSLTNTLLTDEAAGRVLTEGPQQPCFKENWVWKVLRSMAECPAGSERLRRVGRVATRVTLLWPCLSTRLRSDMPGSLGRLERMLAFIPT